MNNDLADGPDVAEIARQATTGRADHLVLARILLDALTVAMATLLALILRFEFELFEVQESSPLTGPAHILATAMWIAAMMVALSSNRLFDEDTLFPGGGESARVLRSVIEAAAAMSLFVFLTQSFYVSRSWFGLTLTLSLLGLAAERRLVRGFLRHRRSRGHLKRPSFLVSSRGEGWSEWYEASDQEFEVLAEVDPSGIESVAAHVLSDPTLARRLQGSALVLKARDFSSDEFWQLVLRAGQLGWSVFVHSPVRSVGRDRLAVRDVAGHTIVKVAPPMLRGVRAFQKRTFDLGASVVGMILLSPILILIAIAIVATTGRPILYKQPRVGRLGRVFDIWKFRTMRVDAEEQTGPVWSVEDDARRTPIGRFLRRTSLDELPQLVNVVLGDMSLVGPRPERPNFVHEFSNSFPWYRFRHRIRPGITGWAQAQGQRGNSELDSRIQSDNWYIENWSIWLDIQILIRTFGEVFRGRNAY